MFVISVIADYHNDSQPRVGVTAGGIWALAMCVCLTVVVIYTTCRVVAMLNDNVTFTKADYVTICIPNLAYLAVAQATYCCAGVKVEYHLSFFFSPRETAKT